VFLLLCTGPSSGSRERIVNVAQGYPPATPAGARVRVPIATRVAALEPSPIGGMAAHVRAVRLVEPTTAGLVAAVLES